MMDNQDQGRTRTRTPGLKGDDDHGVHAWHSGSSGAVEDSNPSDKEHLSDNDPHSLAEDVKVTDDDQMQDPSILQGERDWKGKMPELQAEKPDSHVETLHKSTNDVQVESDDACESSQQITLPTTETSGGIRLDNNENADKSTLSGAQDNEMGTSSRANKECDDTPSVENLSGNSDVLPPSSVPHTFNDNGINRGSLDGNQGSDSGTIEVIEIFAEMTDSDGIILHSPVHSFIPMGNANRSNEPESSANEAVRVEAVNPPTVTDSENATVRRGFNWASCLCCCLGGDR
ncbi:uncharacterized protein LOC111240663 isoform X2 [Vigna radiata var. radiata]|uniref:Uncharacterized protein LOC111240663 isoform X2 n=1 Tax=Vigna radiata var. radiata TaxID=3916 RepID=A0A3Q0EJL9_VIGRR|nr:uncharacterized protein LOC111240663 isoform X2 [Vigna radiata var. radiata]